MRYALIQNDIVVNIIWLEPDNVSDFQNAVPIVGVAASIGDGYVDGKFIYNGIPRLTIKEEENQQLESRDATIAELDAAFAELEYQNALLTLGLTS